MTFSIRSARNEDDYEIDQLIDNILGPGRFVKPSYAYRSLNNHIKELGYVAQNHLENIVGTIRYWPMDKYENVILLGPLVVEKNLRNQGVGIRLIKQTTKIAKKMQYERIILMGDPNYYGNFGFTHDNAKDIIFQKPYNPYKLLGLYL